MTEETYKAHSEKKKLITKTINNYKNFNSEQFRSDIKCAPWSMCEVFNDTDDQVWAWEHLYQNIKQQHISTRKVRGGEHKLPWINKSIRKEQNKRYKLLKEYKTHKDKYIWKRYKNSRNTAKKMIRHVEIRYWKEQFEQAGTDKQFWKIVRKAQGKDKKCQIPPIDDGSGKILVDDLDKAECLNKYFSNIGQELSKKFQDSIVDTNQNFYRITPSCSQIKLSEEQLVQNLKHVKQKSGGTDNISSRELVEAGEALSEGLFGIFKSSIKDSVHPEIWKVGMVIPAVKKVIKSDRANYRPLTMLNLNSKILESVVCDSLDNHLSEEEILHSNQ